METHIVFQRARDSGWAEKGSCPGGGGSAGNLADIVRGWMQHPLMAPKLMSRDVGGIIACTKYTWAQGSCYAVSAFRLCTTIRGGM